MIIRLVLLFIIVVAVLWLLKKLFSAEPESTDDPKVTQDQGENMLQCKFCGIHSPESTTIKQHDHNYCCQDHADQDQ